MTERCKGKMRPSFKRASDLGAPETVRNPSEGRTPRGTFAEGNRHSVEARVKHSIRKTLGSKADAGEAGLVAGDAGRIFGAFMRSMASDAAPVRAMAALAARHSALASFYGSKAVQAGLTTPEGMALQTAADRQSQRAERVLVTAEDLADRHAKASRYASQRTSPVELIRARAMQAKTDGADS